MTQPSLSEIYSGEYAPVVVGTPVGCSVTPTAVSRYIKVGNKVQVMGQVTVTPTTAGTNISFQLSLPFNTSFLSTTQCNGTGTSYTLSNRDTVSILADTSTELPNFRSFASINTAISFTYQFMYEIV